MARSSVGLERTPDKGEVGSSILPAPTRSRDSIIPERKTPMPTLYNVTVRGFDNQEYLQFVQEADSLVDALMKFEDKLGELNRRVKEKFPKYAEDEGYEITEVGKSYAQVFTEEWLTDFISRLCVEYEDEED